MGMFSTQFATDLLAKLGYPATAENIKFMTAWAQAEGGSAAYNPFNTTQGASGSTNYNSVGVKNYTSYQQGLDATAQTLMNGRYSSILQSLASGSSAMQSAQALAASPWGTGNLVVKVLGGNVAAAPATTGGNVATAAPTATPPSLDQLAQQFGFMASQFASDPSLAAWAQQYMSGAFGIAGSAVADAKAKAALTATSWFQTHDANQRSWQNLLASDPAEANNQLVEGTKKIVAMEYQMGVSVDGATLAALTRQAIPNKWSDQEIQQALAAHLDPAKAMAGGSGGVGQSQGATTDALQQVANSYGVPMAKSTIGQWAIHVIDGTQSIESFTQMAKTQAKSLFPGLADQIDKGVTVQQYVSPYLARENQLLEMPDESSSNSTAWMNDPLLKQALQYKPQDAKPTDPPGAMPLYQFEQLVKNDPRWQNTDNAKQGALATVQQLGQAFGVST